MTEPAADVYVERAIELLLNSLYPAQRGEVLKRLWQLYNMDAPTYPPEGQPLTYTHTTESTWCPCSICTAQREMSR